MKVLAVIPTYNEAENVGPLLARLMALPLDLSVLFVDDDSPDGTAERVTAASSLYNGKDIAVYSRRHASRGLGLAYRDGFAEAIRRGPDAILQMDADGQHPPEVILSLVEAMRGHSGADLVLASRYAKGGGTGGWKLSRRFISGVAGGAARLMLRLPYMDLTGGFKLWRTDLLAAMDLSAIESKGYVFQIEMTLRARRMGAKIVEVPFTFGQRTAGETKMSGTIAREAAVKMLRWVVKPPRTGRYQRGRVLE